MKSLVGNYPLILMEAAVVEQLRRTDKVRLHPTLVNAPLIYDEIGRQALGKIYQGYIDIAVEADVPFLMCTPTWRTNQDRTEASDLSPNINSDAVKFLKSLRDSQVVTNQIIKIGGMIGCKNDCYLPDEGLSMQASEQFHAWQVNQLAGAGVDYLIAETLPNVEEARGIAKVMEKTGLPYIISFVISRDGLVLDGTPLDLAIEMIDSATRQKPLGYMVNCAYPSFLCARDQPAQIYNRLIGFQANASSLDHCDLEGADELEMDDISDWGKEMLELNRSYGVKILGGCCGTGSEHLKYVVGQYAAS